tara:strand:+ start:255 stop:686 length:432 start_codon:yes stop_codon:yes gene_type:complete
MKKHENFIKKVKKIKKFSIEPKKVELGLIDNLSYDDVQYLQDEVSRILYSTEEWYDENFDKWLEARNNLNAVYFQNSEAFIDQADVAGDRDILAQIKQTADDLGLPVEDIYDQYEEHIQALDDLDYATERFDEQVRELRDFGF